MNASATTPDTVEEHELPSLEAMLAGTLALMTGYSQALQAELHARERVRMGEKVAANLALLAQHPLLSFGFREVLSGLQRRWAAMRACAGDAPPPHPAPMQHAPPKRLQ